MDLYRLKSVDELDAAGFLDLLEPGAVVAVEWGDRFPAALPRDHLRIEIERKGSASNPTGGDEDGEAPRVLNALAFGPAAEASLARWSGAIAMQDEGS